MFVVYVNRVEMYLLAYRIWLVCFFPILYSLFDCDCDCNRLSTGFLVPIAVLYQEQKLMRMDVLPKDGLGWD